MSATDHAAKVSTTLKLPGSLRMGVARGRIEIRSFFRNREAVAFSLILPLILLCLFATLFAGEVEHTGVDVQQVIVCGVLASAIVSSAIGTFGFAISLEKEDGTLKRLASTPLTSEAYFLGKVFTVLTLAALQIAVTMAVGVAFFHASLPSTFGRWLTFLWVFVLGTSSCTMVGICLGALAPNAQSAPAIINLPFITLQFISGIYFTFTALPAWLRDIAAVFPLKWVAQGIRSTMLPDKFLPAEAGHSWQHLATALVLFAWTVVGFVAARQLFRWRLEGRS